MRGNIYQLAEMIVKDPQLESECKVEVIENQSSISINDPSNSSIFDTADS